MASVKLGEAFTTYSVARQLPDGSTAIECVSPPRPGRTEAIVRRASPEEDAPPPARDPVRPLAARTSRLTVVSLDSAGVGFKDPTPAAPVGGNTGTTLGQQRLNAVNFAAGTWAAALDSPVEIQIGAQFTQAPCSVGFTVLGFAQTPEAFMDFPGAGFPGTWYPAALANRRAGRDLHPDDGTLSSYDIAVYYNDLERSACSESGGWYYGLDGAHGPKVDLVRLTLHELGHGLGFVPYVNPATGAEFLGRPDVFERHVLDLSAGKHWHEMTDAERVTSATNAPSVVWDGGAVTASAPAVLRRGVPVLTAPAVLSGDREAGPADFGPGAPVAGLSGLLASSPTDACSPLTNASNIAGKIALVDLARLPCLWVTQAFNVQKAGALAVLLADYNDSGLPQRVALVSDDPGMVIPTVSITKADGAALRAAIASGPVNVSVRLDLSRLVGADASGLVRLYAPRPLAPSAIGHFDFNALPPLLMNPFQGTPGETQSLDLTLPLLRDIGWYPDSAERLPSTPVRRTRSPRSHPPRT